MNAEKATHLLVDGIDAAYKKHQELLYHKALGYMDCYKKLRPLAGHELGCHHNFAVNPECTCSREEAIK